MDKLRNIIRLLLDIENFNSMHSLKNIVREIDSLNIRDINKKNISYLYRLIGYDLEKSNMIQNNITMLSIYISRNRDTINNDSIKKVKKLIKIISNECSNIILIGKSIREEINIQEVREVREKLNWQILELEDTHKKIKNLEDRLNNYNREYVTILGIFASIALAFVGGITFLVSVLQNIHNLNIWIGLVTISLLGLVLSNVLFILFSFLSNIIRSTNKFVNNWYYILFNLLMIIILIFSLKKYFQI